MNHLIGKLFKLNKRISVKILWDKNDVDITDITNKDVFMLLSINTMNKMNDTEVEVLFKDKVGYLTLYLNDYDFNHWTEYLEEIKL